MPPVDEVRSSLALQSENNNTLLETFTQGPHSKGGTIHLQPTPKVNKEQQPLASLISEQFEGEVGQSSQPFNLDNEINRARQDKMSTIDAIRPTSVSPNITG